MSRIAKMRLPMSIPRQPIARSLPVTVDRGARVADFGHGWGQVVHAESGVLRVDSADASWVLTTGRALWVPPGLQPELVCGTRVHLRTVYLSPRVPARDHRVQVLAVSPLLRELLLAVARRAPLGQDGPSGRLVAALVDELAAASTEPGELPLPRDPGARRLALRILASPGATSLDAQIEGCGASRRTLERRFIQQVGASLGTWRRLARLHHARLALAEGSSVAEAAERAGYATSSAFVRAFRSHFGTTPARWAHQ